MNFPCTMCDVKKKSQINLNSHLLFDHGFLNPDCSTDADTVVENYLYSKDHFKHCLICNRYTDGYVSFKELRNSILNVKDPRFYFCDTHLKAKNLDKYRIAILVYMQTARKNTLAMYRKTLTSLIKGEGSLK